MAKFELLNLHLPSLSLSLSLSHTHTHTLAQEEGAKKCTRQKLTAAAAAMKCRCHLIPKDFVTKSKWPIVTKTSWTEGWLVGRYQQLCM